MKRQDVVKNAEDKANNKIRIYSCCFKAKGFVSLSIQFKALHRAARQHSQPGYLTILLELGNTDKYIFIITTLNNSTNKLVQKMYPLTLNNK